jgi:hypothetical protein
MSGQGWTCAGLDMAGLVWCGFGIGWAWPVLCMGCAAYVLGWAVHGMGRERAVPGIGYVGHGLGRHRTLRAWVRPRVGYSRHVQGIGWAWAEHWHYMAWAGH